VNLQIGDSSDDNISPLEIKYLLRKFSKFDTEIEKEAMIVGKNLKFKYVGTKEIESNSDIGSDTENEY